MKEWKKEKHVRHSLEDYASIQYSRVSWRRKSSYRKAIKKRTSKLVRALLKRELFAG